MTDAEVLRATGDADDPAIERAAILLREGKLVAFPTETVYGLGANALDERAVAGIFLAKGRPAYNPLIVHVPETAVARTLVSAWPDSAQKLAAAFWPGPLTIVLPKVSAIPSLVTAGLETVAVRVPAHPVARALLRAAGVPIAAPSANRSESVSPTTAEHVRAGLGDRIPLILDGGPTEVGIESTVIDLSASAPVVLRPGMISAAQLAEVLGAAVGTIETTDGASPRSSPGQLHRHYAPKARVVIFSGEGLPPLEPGDGVLLAQPSGVPNVREIVLPSDPAGYARGFYAALHTFDAAGAKRILVQAPPADPAWAGVRDRLRRAANH